MIPVHIWVHAKAIDIANFPDYFYDIQKGRQSLYEKPIIHKRYGRLNYEHAGEFAQNIIRETGKPAIHIFILTPKDWLRGPYNYALTDVCQSILEVTWTNNYAVTLFVSLSGPRSHDIPAETYNSYNLILERRCQRRSRQTALIRPLNQPSIDPFNVTYIHERLADPAIIPFFRELRALIFDVKLVNKLSPAIWYSPKNRVWKETSNVPVSNTEAANPADLVDPADIINPQ